MFRALGTIAASTLAGHALTLALTPLLTRYFGVEAFGYLGQVTAWASALMVVATLKLELAIPQQASWEAVRVVGQVMALATLAVVVMILTAGLIASSPVFATLVALQVASFAWFAYERAVEIRAKALHRVAAGRFLQAGGTGVLQLALGVAVGYTGGNLALGTAAGYCLGAMTGLFARERRAVEGPRVSLAQVWRANATHGLYTTPASLVTLAGAQAPAIALGNWFSDAAAGHYTLAMRILVVPMALLGQAVGQVFLAEASDKVRAGESIAPVIERYTALLARLGLPAFASLAVLAPSLFPMAFGHQWQEAGWYASTLSLWLAVQFVWSPVSVAGQLLGKQRQILFFTSMEFLSRLGALGVGLLTGEVRHSILAFAVVSTMTTMGFGTLIVRWSGVSAAVLWRAIAPSLAASGLCLILGIILAEQTVVLGLILVSLLVPYYVREFQRYRTQGASA